MKKLSVLMASLMCLTVGGVYAAWTYAETNIANYHSEEKVVALAEVSTDSTAYGTYKVEFSDDFKIEIDSAQALGLTGQTRASGTGVYHQHEAVLTATGSITVSFKPAAQASDDVKDFGILTNVYFSTSKEMDTMKWKDGNNIFAFDDNSCTFGFGDDNLATGAVDSAKWTWDEEDGRFEYVFDTAALKSIFTLREGIVLDSSKLHDDFFMITEGLTTTVHMHQVSAAVSE